MVSMEQGSNILNPSPYPTRHYAESLAPRTATGLRFAE